MNPLDWRPWCLAAVALLCAAPYAEAQQKLNRDWQKYPAIVEVDTPNDIYAVGDPHADYERLISVLVSAKVIPADPGPPEKVQWRAGKATLVCTGDLIDKWDQSMRVIALFRALEVQAAKAGGRVIVTMGNHEAEFLGDPEKRKQSKDSKKKPLDFADELIANKLSPEDVAAGTDKLGIGVWLRSLPIAARVNDWFFAHAGNTANRSLAKLRGDLQAGLVKDGFKTQELLGDNSIVEARMHPHPWWENKGDNEMTSKTALKKCVDALGVNHLVIGHQPNAITFGNKTTRPQGELFQHFDGMVFLIDTGMSHSIAFSPGAVLHISQVGKKVQAVRILASGKQDVLWSGASGSPGKAKIVEPTCGSKMASMSLASNRLNLAGLVTHRIALTELGIGYEGLLKMKEK